MLIHVCALCGYEYNPKEGDPDNGVKENTDFEDIPEDWVCPLCGASKEDFEAELREDDDEESY
ncbi:MAG: rubredoxin [Clostridia bacterium]|nr:rubredoxin [Clostridia bacterium]